jgi:hypothetical protein
VAQLFSLGVGAVRLFIIMSRRSKRRAKLKHKPKPAQKPKLEIQTLAPEKRPSKIWRFVTSLWAIVGGVAVMLGLIGGFFLFVPRVTVSPYVSADPKEPFEMNFVLENQGYFGIKDIAYIPNVLSLVSPNGREFLKNFGAGASGVPPIPPGQKAYLQASDFHMILGAKGCSAFFKITVVFKEDWLPKKTWFKTS